MEKIRLDLLNNLDKNIADITEANFRKRQYVLDNMNNILEDRKTKEANKLKINEEMSALRQFYVD